MVASRNNDSVKQLWPLPDGAARDKMGPMRMRTMVLISPMTGVTRECLPLPADIDDGGADGKPLITVSTGLLDDIKAFSVGGLEHKHLQRMVRFLMSDRPELTDDLVEEVISQAQDTEMTSEEATLMMWNIIWLSSEFGGCGSNTISWLVTPNAITRDYCLIAVVMLLLVTTKL